MGNVENVERVVKNNPPVSSDANPRLVEVKPLEYDMIAEVRKAKVSRVHAKRFFLTYSQVPYTLMPESVINQLEGKVDFSEYVTGEEYHADGRKHLHEVLVSSRRHDVCFETMFDTEFGGKTYVSHCQTIKNLNATIRYVWKENSYITNLKNLYYAELLPVDGLMRAMANQEGIDRALEYYDENHPHRAVGWKSLVSMERHLTRRKKVQLRNSLAAKGSVSTPFEVSGFRSIPEIESWVKNDCRPTLIMVGPSGCGKTQFVKGLAAREGLEMLRVSDKEALKWLTDE